MSHPAGQLDHNNSLWIVIYSNSAFLKSPEIPFDSSVFDAVISISTLQWIFHGFKPERILERIRATTLEIYRVVKEEGKAVFQFYPKGPLQLDLAGRSFLKAGFQVTKVIDDPKIPKLRKIFLLCSKG